MNIFTKFRSDEKVEVKIKLFTISDESKKLSIGLFFRDIVCFGSYRLQLGYELFQVVAKVHILSLFDFRFLAVFAADQ